MSFPAYPKYKDSGVAWLGRVPAHWEMWKFKNLFTERTSDNSDNFPAGSISFGEVVFKNEENLHEPTKESYQVVHEGDFLINPINLNYDQKSLRTALSEINVCVSPAYIVLKANGALSKRFFKYQFYAFDVFHMKTLGAGVRQTITFADIGACFTGLPPLAEQEAIAAFLDRETGKIDALVEEQGRLITLLKEKRRAVISHAVTRGLNPAAPLRPSGIEWLGDVPAHWRTAPLKRDVQFITSGSRGWAENYSDEGALFIRIGNLTRYSLQLDLSDIQRVKVPEGTEGERTRVTEGDVLFSITAYLGSVAVAPKSLEPAFVSQHVALVRLYGAMLSPYWVGYVTLSDVGVRYLDSRGYGGTKIQLSLGDVLELTLPIPPLAEQTAIVAHLDAETAKLDALTAEAERATGLLRERRAALISAAVTGRIAVRGAAALDPVKG